MLFLKENSTVFHILTDQISSLGVRGKISNYPFCQGRSPCVHAGAVFNVVNPEQFQIGSQ